MRPLQTYLLRVVFIEIQTSLILTKLNFRDKLRTAETRKAEDALYPKIPQKSLFARVKGKKEED